MNEILNEKKWVLTVKYLSDVDGYDDHSGNIGDFSFTVLDGPDGEIGLPGNVARSFGWFDGEIISARLDQDNNLCFEKLMQGGATVLTA